MKRFIAIFMTLCLVLGMSSVSVWATEASEWQEEISMPVNMCFGCSCAVGDKIYVIGGYNSAELNNVQIYDTQNQIWTKGKSMPTKRYYLTASIVGDKIYVISGKNSRTVEIYDTQTDTWTTGANMPTARERATSCIINDRIYVIGGIDSEGYTATVEIYDPQTDTWTTGKSMPTARYNLTSSVIGDKIYAIGGHGGNVLNTVEIYDPKTDTWTTGKSMPTARYYLTSSVIGDKIYAIGGYVSTPRNTFDTVEIYDPQTDTWTTGKSMPTARYGLTSSVIGDKIYAIGGCDNGNNCLGTMESLQVENSSYISSAKLVVLLNKGETVQFSTSFDLDNNKTFIWTSTNEAAATVDANGKVIAVGVGDTDIYAESADGTFKEYIPVKVVEGIADELRLAVHLKTSEKAKLYLVDDPSQVKWSSMDESVATISEEGQVTGVKKGLAIVKAELDGQTYQIYVRVNG